MKIGYTTENPSKEYGKAIKKAKDLCELIEAIKPYREVAEDAYERVIGMSDEDFEQFRKDLPKFKNAKGKIAEVLNQKWGMIILPRILLISSLMEIQFMVPWGCVFIRGKELKQF